MLYSIGQHINNLLRCFIYLVNR